MCMYNISMVLYCVYAIVLVLCVEGLLYIHNFMLHTLSWEKTLPYIYTYILDVSSICIYICIYTHGDISVCIYRRIYACRNAINHTHDNKNTNKNTTHMHACQLTHIIYRIIAIDRACIYILYTHVYAPAVLRATRVSVSRYRPWSWRSSCPTPRFPGKFRTQTPSSNKKCIHI